ncbi:MAG: hypothetical protein WBZ36_13420 [Candidatus Nitrosopolaris sp.]
MECDVCSVFESIPADNRFIRALILHVKILHKQAGGSSSGCEMCKQIETNIEEDKASGAITTLTLKEIKTHMKLLHSMVDAGPQGMA